MTEASPRLTPEEEKLAIRDITLAAESQTKEGDTFYLITQRYHFVSLRRSPQIMEKSIVLRIYFFSFFILNFQLLFLGQCPLF